MLAEFELEFEPRPAHLSGSEMQTEVSEMLYQDKPLGQFSLAAWMTAWLAGAFRRRRYSDLDLLASSRHLRRDVGLEASAPGLRPADYIWRK